MIKKKKAGENTREKSKRTNVHLSGSKRILHSIKLWGEEGTERKGYLEFQYFFPAY